MAKNSRVPGDEVVKAYRRLHCGVVRGEFTSGSKLCGLAAVVAYRYRDRVLNAVELGMTQKEIIEKIAEEKWGSDYVTGFTYAFDGCDEATCNWYGNPERAPRRSHEGWVDGLVALSAVISAGLHSPENLDDEKYRRWNAVFAATHRKNVLPMCAEGI